MRTRHLLLSAALSAAVLTGCGRAPTPADVEAVPVTRAQAAEEASEGFTFPKDSGGKLLSAYLPPEGKGFRAVPDKTAAPLALRNPRAIEPKVEAWPSNQAEMPRLAVAETPRGLRPGALRDEPPLSADLVTVVLPERDQLPALAGTHVPSPSAEEVAPLPILARAQSDRAPLTDPTADASLTAALSAVPGRSEPAPFVKQELPGGQRASVRLKNATEELALTGAPKPPQP